MGELPVQEEQVGYEAAQVGRVLLQQDRDGVTEDLYPSAVRGALFLRRNRNGIPYLLPDKRCGKDTRAPAPA